MKKHNLFLSLYTFKIKRSYTSNTEIVDINAFLSTAYPDKKLINKFAEGFVQDIVNLIDLKTFKNERGTHGGIIDQKAIEINNRIFDVLIDGGITGIKQLVIDESGRKQIISDEEIVGPKFFARFWMPAGGDTGYIFIQKYGTLSLKPLFDDIIMKIVKDKQFALVGNQVFPTTTQKRLKEFIKNSSLKNVIVTSSSSINSTGAPSAVSATIKISGIKLNSSGHISVPEIGSNLLPLGIQLTKSNYGIKAIFENKQGDFKEERTATIQDTAQENLNIIPSIAIPDSCVDDDNYPIFVKMQEFSDKEIKQLLREQNS